MTPLSKQFHASVGTPDEEFRNHDLSLELSQFLTRERHRIHLVGVAGSGMSGVAALLLELGHTVSGSDKVSTLETERLQRLGLRFHGQHQAEHASDAELVIFSSAIKSDNLILASARNSGKLMVRRAEALAAIMRNKRAILIAGMHGKTTTSAMAAHVLREAGLHPSHYVGAEIPILGSNAHWDSRGEYFVGEGDESDGTLRCFNPEHALILNIEEEHLDFYADLGAIEKVFTQLIDQTRGTVFYNADDPNTARLCARRNATISYGLSEKACYRGNDIKLRDFASIFCVYRHGEKLGEATLNVPGDTDILMSPGAYRQHCRSSRRPVRFSGYIQGSVLAPPRHACSRRRRRRRSDHVGQAPEMFGIRLDHAASSVCCRKEDLPEPSPRPTGEGCALLPSGERQ